MKISLVYATYSSGTLTAAEYLQAALIHAGHECNLIQVLDFDEAAVSELDLLLWFSPSWERGNFAHNGQPHHDYFVLFKKWSYDPDVSDEKRTSTLQLAHIPSIVIGLGDRKYPVFCGAVDMIEDFLTRSQSELIHASVRIDGYYFNTDRAHSQLDQLAIDISSIQK